MHRCHITSAVVFNRRGRHFAEAISGDTHRENISQDTCVDEAVSMRIEKLKCHLYDVRFLSGRSVDEIEWHHVMIDLPRGRSSSVENAGHIIDGKAFQRKERRQIHLMHSAFRQRLQQPLHISACHDISPFDEKCDFAIEPIAAAPLGQRILQACKISDRSGSIGVSFSALISISIVVVFEGPNRPYDDVVECHRCRTSVTAFH